MQAFQFGQIFQFIGGFVAILIGSLIIILVIKNLIKFVKMCSRCSRGNHEWENLDEDERIFRCKVCGIIDKLPSSPDNKPESTLENNEKEEEVVKSKGAKAPKEKFKKIEICISDDTLTEIEEVLGEMAVSIRNLTEELARWNNKGWLSGEYSSEKKNPLPEAFSDNSRFKIDVYFKQGE